MRQLFVAIPLLFGLAMALLPFQAGGLAVDSMSLIESATDLVLQHSADHEAAAGHKKSDLDDHHAKAGHCTPGITLMAVDGQCHVAVILSTRPYRVDEAFRAGLRPLPILPPPERT